MEEIKDRLGIKTIRKVSEHTTVIEWKKGGAEPASGIVRKMWELLTGEKV